MSNSHCVGLLHYHFPPKATLQAYWPCRPETFPVHSELYHIWEPPSIIHQALYCHYRHTMLGYTISELGWEAWIFYKWVHSAIDEVVNQHSFHSVFEYEPVAQPDGQTTMTMIMWDELNMEMRHHPLLWAQKLHIHNIIPSPPLVPGPNLDLSDPEGLLAQFLPSVSKLLLQPFPTEQYCSVYCFAAVHLVQILQGFLSWPYRQEPPPQTLLFYMSVCRHLHVVNTDLEAGTFNFHFLKSTSLHPFLLQLTLDAQCALGSGLSERCHADF